MMDKDSKLKKSQICLAGACLLFVVYLAFYEDLWGALKDAGVCLLAQLFLWQFWVFLAVTLVLKQKMLLPCVEQYYKRTYAERSKLRKRRLRDTLDDPVLALKMEEQILRRRDVAGDRSKMLEAMAQIREMSNDNSESAEENYGKGDTTKGQEKYEAANAIFYGTIIVFILLFALFNCGFPWTGTYGMDEYPFFMPATTQRVYRPYSVASQPRLVRAKSGILQAAQEYDSVGRRRLSEGVFLNYYDYCGKYGFMLCNFLFCLIHLLHSYKLVRGATRKQRRSTAPNNEEESKSGLENPLLSASEKADEES